MRRLHNGAGVLLVIIWLFCGGALGQTQSNGEGDVWVDGFASGDETASSGDVNVTLDNDGGTGGTIDLAATGKSEGDSSAALTGRLNLSCTEEPCASRGDAAAANTAALSAEGRQTISELESKIRMVESAVAGFRATQTQYGLGEANGAITQIINDLDSRLDSLNAQLRVAVQGFAATDTDAHSRSAVQTETELAEGRSVAVGVAETRFNGTSSALGETSIGVQTEADGVEKNGDAKAAVQSNIGEGTIEGDSISMVESTEDRLKVALAGGKIRFLGDTDGESQSAANAEVADTHNSAKANAIAETLGNLNSEGSHDVYTERDATADTNIASVNSTIGQSGTEDHEGLLATETKICADNSTGPGCAAAASAGVEGGSFGTDGSGFLETSARSRSADGTLTSGVDANVEAAGRVIGTSLGAEANASEAGGRQASVTGSNSVVGSGSSGGFANAVLQLDNAETQANKSLAESELEADAASFDGTKAELDVKGDIAIFESDKQQLEAVTQKGKAAGWGSKGSEVSARMRAKLSQYNLAHIGNARTTATGKGEGSAGAQSSVQQSILNELRQLVVQTSEAAVSAQGDEAAAVSDTSVTSDGNGNDHIANFAHGTGIGRGTVGVEIHTNMDAKNEELTKRRRKRSAGGGLARLLRRQSQRSHSAAFDQLVRLVEDHADRRRNPDAELRTIPLDTPAPPRPQPRADRTRQRPPTAPKRPQGQRRGPERPLKPKRPVPRERGTEERYTESGELANGAHYTLTIVQSPNTERVQTSRSVSYVQGQGVHVEVSSRSRARGKRQVNEDDHRTMVDATAAGEQNEVNAQTNLTVPASLTESGTGYAWVNGTSTGSTGNDTQGDGTAAVRTVKGDGAVELSKGHVNAQTRGGDLSQTVFQVKTDGTEDATGTGDAEAVASSLIENTGNTSVVANATLEHSLTGGEENKTSETSVSATGGGKLVGTGDITGEAASAARQNMSRPEAEQQEGVAVAEGAALSDGQAAYQSRVDLRKRMLKNALEARRKWLRAQVRGSAVLGGEESLGKLALVENQASGDLGTGEGKVSLLVAAENDVSGDAQVDAQGDVADRNSTADFARSSALSADGDGGNSQQTLLSGLTVSSGGVEGASEHESRVEAGDGGGLTAELAGTEQLSSEGQGSLQGDHILTAEGTGAEGASATLSLAEKSEMLNGAVETGVSGNASTAGDAHGHSSDQNKAVLDADGKETFLGNIVIVSADGNKKGESSSVLGLKHSEGASEVKLDAKGEVLTMERRNSTLDMDAASSIDDGQTGEANIVALSGRGFVEGEAGNASGLQRTFVNDTAASLHSAVDATAGGAGEASAGASVGSESVAKDLSSSIAQINSAGDVLGDQTKIDVHASVKDDTALTQAALFRQRLRARLFTNSSSGLSSFGFGGKFSADRQNPTG